ncbi:MAG: hypothetical protein ACLU8J_00845 [Acutalibacter sp.]
MTPNENQLEALLKLAAQRMGTTPQALKDAAQRGDLSHLAGNASGQDAANLRKVLSDPEAAKKLPTPQAQKLLQLLGNQGKPKP